MLPLDTRWFADSFAVVFALVLIGLVVVVVLYNALVTARLRVREAWAAIDMQLQRRASLIPNLVEVVKGYAAYERGTLQQVVEARGKVNAAGSSPPAAAAASAELSGALQSFFAVAEAYPDLKANERYAQLQHDLSDTEDKIAYARNYYNGAVETYNTRVQSFPSLLLAAPSGFRAAEFFNADESSRAGLSVEVRG
jgi:LemA protein